MQINQKANLRLNKDLFKVVHLTINYIFSLKIFEIMKNILKILFFASLFFAFFSCKKDEDIHCLTCTSSETLDFELCRESNGNASINGEDTQTPYDVYLSDLQEEGVLCN